MAVKLHTNHGVITLELDAEKAPVTVAKFLAYVEAGHYNNTVFHRVIDGFMIQGGGFEPGMNQKPTGEQIKNEADNGLKNERGTIAMARTQAPHSATAQFFINVADNDFLNHRSPDLQGWGYCVFGQRQRGHGRGRRDPQGEDRLQRLPPGRAEGRRGHRARRSRLIVAARDPSQAASAPARPGGAATAMPEAARAALPALFISDLHLSEDEPANVDAFLGFLQGPAREAASLFILGDLFEYWAGDDDLATPFNARIAAAIRALADAGTAVFFMTGNRDLLAGPAFADAIGATLLEDPARVRFGDDDEAPTPGCCSPTATRLCTDDLAYQAYRRQVRDPAWQAGFLPSRWPRARPSSPACARRAKPPRPRRPWRSWTSTPTRSPRCCASTAIRRWCTATPTAPTATTSIDGRDCVRHVLSDWRGKACWLSWDGRYFTPESGDAVRI